MSQIILDKLSSFTCSECANEYLRTRKQVNAVIKRSGKWTCKTCTLILRNKSLAKEIGATRIHNRTGYVLEKTIKGWVRQHIYVMEKHIGRKIRPNEAVHHINFIKTDNDLNNLMLMNHGEHTALHNIERAKNGLRK